MALGTSLPARLPTSSGTRVFYVDAATGNDSNAGTSEGAAWASLQDYFSGTAGPANNVAPTPGDIVWVKDYPGQTSAGESSIGYRPGGANLDHVINNRSGTALDPITVQAYPGHRPMILGPSAAPGTAIARCLRLTGTSSYWRFQGFDFPYAAGTGGNDPCIYLAGSSNHFEFYDCWIHGSTDGSGIFADTLTSFGHFINCHFYANDDWRFTTGVADPSQQSHGIYLGGCDDYFFANCITRDHANGFGCQIRLGSKRCLLVNCLSIRNNGDTASTAEFGGFLVEGDAATTQDNLVINSIAMFNNRGLNSLSGSTTLGNRAYRNVSYENRTRAGSLSNFNNPTAGTGWDYSAAATGDFTGPGDNLITDPLLSNAAANDFSLLAGSSAIAAGLDIYTPTFDITGAARVNADIGPYRYAAAAGAGRRDLTMMGVA